MKIEDIDLGALVLVTAKDLLERGAVVGRRVGGLTEGLVDEGAYPGVDVVGVAIEYIGVPPEKMAATCLPEQVEKTSPLAKVEVDQDYLMQDARILRVVRERTAEDGHKRVELIAVEGHPKEILDCSMQQFVADTLWKIDREA